MAPTEQSLEVDVEEEYRKRTREQLQESCLLARIRMVAGFGASENSLQAAYKILQLFERFREPPDFDVQALVAHEMLQELDVDTIAGMSQEDLTSTLITSLSTR